MNRAEKSRQGCPKKITGDDLKWLYDAVTMDNPLNHKLPFCLWTAGLTGKGTWVKAIEEQCLPRTRSLGAESTTTDL